MSVRFACCAHCESLAWSAEACPERLKGHPVVCDWLFTNGEIESCKAGAQPFVAAPD